MGHDRGHAAVGAAGESTVEVAAIHHVALAGAEAQGIDRGQHHQGAGQFARLDLGEHPAGSVDVCFDLLPQGFDGRPFRSTDGMVFVCVEGAGSVEVGGQRLSFAPRDVFVVPGWMAYRLRADADSVLFSFSDRVAQEKLGLYREARLSA
jgi:gentisate 1,2-dioxygenase